MKKSWLKVLLAYGLWAGITWAEEMPELPPPSWNPQWTEALNLPSSPLVEEGRLVFEGKLLYFKGQFAKLNDQPFTGLSYSVKKYPETSICHIILIGYRQGKAVGEMEYNFYPAGTTLRWTEDGGFGKSHEEVFQISTNRKRIELRPLEDGQTHILHYDHFTSTNRMRGEDIIGGNGKLAESRQWDAEGREIPKKEWKSPSQTAAEEATKVEALGFQWQRDPKKLVVAGVRPSSPAASGKFEKDDVILLVEGAEVKIPKEFLTKVFSFAWGSKLKIRVERNGKPVVLYLLVPMPAE